MSLDDKIQQESVIFGEQVVEKFHKMKNETRMLLIGFTDKKGNIQIFDAIPYKEYEERSEVYHIPSTRSEVDTVINTAINKKGYSEKMIVGVLHKHPLDDLSKTDREAMDIFFSAHDNALVYAVISDDNRNLKVYGKNKQKKKAFSSINGKPVPYD